MDRSNVRRDDWQVDGTACALPRWLEEAWLQESFFFVEGDTISFQIDTHELFGVRTEDLEEALLWDVDGHSERDGMVRSAEGLANLAELRGVLLRVLRKIEAAMPPPKTSQVSML
jgi:hypothetical protein